MDEGQEYLFYPKNYTVRVMIFTIILRNTLPETHAKKCLNFTDSFHNVSMSDQYEPLASYIEPADYTDKNDLGNVNINSSIDQIGRRRFAGKQVGDPLVSFTDINDTCSYPTDG